MSKAYLNMIDWIDNAKPDKNYNVSKYFLIATITLCIMNVMKIK